MTNQLRVPAAVAGIDPATACAEIDLAAFRANVATLQAARRCPGDGCGEGRRLRARDARVRSGGEGLPAPSGLA